MAVNHAGLHQYDQPMRLQQNFSQVKMASQGRESI